MTNSPNYCGCCSRWTDQPVVVSYPDATGHTWETVVCTACRARCTHDGAGRHVCCLLPEPRREWTTGDATVALLLAGVVAAFIVWGVLTGHDAWRRGIEREVLQQEALIQEAERSNEAERLGKLRKQRQAEVWEVLGPVAPPAAPAPALPAAKRERLVNEVQAPAAEPVDEEELNRLLAKVNEALAAEARRQAAEEARWRAKYAYAEKIDRERALQRRARATAEDRIRFQILPGVLGWWAPVTLTALEYFDRATTRPGPVRVRVVPADPPGRTQPSIHPDPK
jgi:hypothetical protein